MGGLAQVKLSTMARVLQERLQGCHGPGLPTCHELGTKHANATGTNLPYPAVGLAPAAGGVRLGGPWWDSHGIIDVVLLQGYLQPSRLDTAGVISEVGEPQPGCFAAAVNSIFV